MRKLKFLVDELVLSLLLILPNTHLFCKLRVKFYAYLGCSIGKKVSIAANVRVTGCCSVGDFSSIAHNCTISGRTAGVFIGDFVMIAPGCVFVAFDHVYDDLTVPMVQQGFKEAPIYIENNVWIGANCTITKGVRIREGSIIAANSVVTKDVEKFGIYGGVPAKLIRKRQAKN